MTKETTMTDLITIRKDAITGTRWIASEGVRSVPGVGAYKSLAAIKKKVARVRPRATVEVEEG